MILGNFPSSFWNISLMCWIFFQDDSGERKNFEKGSSPTGKSSSGSESPKPGRRRFGSTADEIDVTKLNGMAENAINNATSSSNSTTASNAELEAMKQEILREMRKEMSKMKQDIIEGKWDFKGSRRRVPEFAYFIHAFSILRL